MLSDIHINAAQTLLSHQFPELSGFQLTNYSQSYGKFQLASNNSIQIHHTDAFHWAVSTSIKELVILGQCASCRTAVSVFLGTGYVVCCSCAVFILEVHSY